MEKKNDQDCNHGIKDVVFISSFIPRIITLEIETMNWERIYNQIINRAKNNRVANAFD